ncbi:MAG: hypothetical protein Q8O67_03120 [Deltaproteobacteria bacterium]|nr:hypothetical protein [Deltaproteobacteria bacterium]
MGIWAADVDVNRPGRALGDLRDDEANYANACAGWTSREDAGEIPDRHVDDVYVLTDDMLQACGDMMRAGRTSQGDFDGVDEMRDRIRSTVDGHHDRLDDALAAEAMHQECDDHHREMVELLDETEVRLRGGGMMGSSGAMN